jgi:hypothetical protein
MNQERGGALRKKSRVGEKWVVDCRESVKDE